MLSHYLNRAARYLWASPWTAVGLMFGILASLAGARFRRVDGVVECWGGAVGYWLDRFSLVRGAVAVTLGHTILARDELYLDLVRPHELVHVKQYEKWGPLMVPAYFACWLWIALRGGDPYHDNLFEREAFQRSGTVDCSSLDHRPRSRPK